MSDTWTFDAPTGVYKSHQMSNDLREAAIAKTVVMPFVALEDGSGKKVGETVTVTRVSNISVPTNARIAESDQIPEDSITMSTTAVTMVEWGRSVPFTSLNQDLSKFDPENKIQRQLKNQLALVLDTAAATEMTSSNVKVKGIPNGIATLTFDTDGTPSTASTVNLNYYHLERIRDYMVDTLLVPGYYENGDYAGLCSTQACRGLKDDPKFESWNQYTSADKKANSELGRIEQIRIIESNNTNAFSKNLGTNTNTGESVFFGEDFCTMAVAQDPELRVQVNKGQDYGRQHGVAWYGILEFLTVWNTASAGEARGVHLTSS
jgi:N4-gp56 family major capsid protein